MTADPWEVLLVRLRDLGLVDIDVLVGEVTGPPAAELVAAFVADLEDALGQARIAMREAHASLGAGPDPLGLLDRTPDLRARGGEAALGDLTARLRDRAAARRRLAQLEEAVRSVLPRLLEADRRLTSF